MQCNRASFTSLREVSQIATVRQMNAQMRTITDRHILCTGKGTFTDASVASPRVYPCARRRQSGGFV